MPSVLCSHLVSTNRRRGAAHKSLRRTIWSVAAGAEQQTDNWKTRLRNCSGAIGTDLSGGAAEVTPLAALEAKY